MLILVTGGLGFIGSHLVDRFIEEGHNVHVVDDLSTGQKSNLNERAVNFITDVVAYCEQTDIKYDKIYHLANNARIARSFDYPGETLLNNHNSTVAICEYIRKTGSGHLFFASSSTTEFTDRFNNPYTFTKHQCDEVLELYRIHYNLKCSTIKFYNAYGSMREKDLGEHTTIVRKFKQLVNEGKPLPVIGTGERRRDFTHIDDTIDALALINKIETDHLPDYHIGTGKNYRILDVARAFDHPITFVPDRKYELMQTLCQPNVNGWEAKIDLIEHIKQWSKENANR